MAQLLQFLFILIVPVALAAGALASLFALGALLDALEHPDDMKRRIEAFFRRPPKPARPPGDRHYYKPYWAK